MSRPACSQPLHTSTLGQNTKAGPVLSQPRPRTQPSQLSRRVRLSRHVHVQACETGTLPTHARISCAGAAAVCCLSRAAAGHPGVLPCRSILSHAARGLSTLRCGQSRHALRAGTFKTPCKHTRVWAMLTLAVVSHTSRRHTTTSQHKESRENRVLHSNTTALQAKPGGPSLAQQGCDPSSKLSL